jgi:hypothetical protein
MRDSAMGQECAILMISSQLACRQVIAIRETFLLPAIELFSVVNDRQGNSTTKLSHISPHPRTKRTT